MDKLLQNDLFTRLLALALAILVYVQVAGQNGGAVQRTVGGVPVEVVGVPQGLSVFQITPRQVQVTVSGSRPSINALAPSSLLGTVSLANAKTGTGQYYISVNNLPSGVQIVKTTPQDATVVVEPLETFNTSVQVDVHGVAASGFVVGTPQVQPSKIVVLIGPESAIAQVVRTVASVSVQSARADVTDQVPPVPLDKNGQPVSGIQVAPSEVRITVPVAPVPAQPQAAVAPKISGTPANGYSVTGVTASPSAVTILGPGNVPLGILSVPTRPLSVAGATATVHADEPVVVPKGATGSTPSSVQVTATIARSG